MYGKYGRAWLRALREAKPDLLQELERDGSLARLVQERDELAANEEDQQLSAMLQESPMPDGPPLARAEHHARLRRRAEEITMYHMLEELAVPAAESQDDGVA
jgi:hypothetical protein